MRKKINSEIIGWWLSGLLAVALLFTILFSSCNTPKKNCLTFDYVGKSVICLNNECDTVDHYYENRCSNCIVYEVDSATIYICGSYDVENLDSIEVKPIE